MGILLATGVDWNKGFNCCSRLWGTGLLREATGICGRYVDAIGPTNTVDAIGALGPATDGVIWGEHNSFRPFLSALASMAPGAEFHSNIEPIGGRLDCIEDRWKSTLRAADETPFADVGWPVTPIRRPSWNDLRNECPNWRECDFCDFKIQN